MTNGEIIYKLNNMYKEIIYKTLYKNGMKHIKQAYKMRHIIREI